MKKPAIRTSATVLATALILIGCATGGGYYGGGNDPYADPQQRDGMSRTSRGALIGAGIGAVAGLLAGSDATERRQRAMVGAGIGGLAGGAIGNYQDRQERALREQTQGTGIEVNRQGDNITLNLPDGITFDFGKSDLKPQFYSALNGVARTLAEYNQTIIEVVGHTDSVGSDAVNQRLSEQRAASVASYLSAQGVQRERIEQLGAGKRYPIASNDTEAGRAQNRRVEIRVIPLRN